MAYASGSSFTAVDNVRRKLSCFTNACMAVSRKKSKPKYARNPTKPSTIHDHLLELAIQGQLQASVYLEKEAILQNLAQTEQDPRLWVYRDWRAQEATLSYLDFRLYQIQQIWQKKE